MIRNADWIAGVSLKNPPYVASFRLPGNVDPKLHFPYESLFTCKNRDELVVLRKEGVINNSRPVDSVDLEGYVPMISPFVPFEVTNNYQNMRALYDYQYTPKEKIDNIAGDYDGDDVWNAKEINIPWGLISHGYILRCGYEFTKPLIKDGEGVLRTQQAANTYFLEPNDYVCAESMEELNVPDDVTVFVESVWNYERCGITVTTPLILPPGFKGKIPIKFFNTRTDSVVNIQPGQGCIKLRFMKV